MKDIPWQTALNEASRISPTSLKCQGCGKEETFESPAAAFEAGWDCPPYFTGYITCDSCPISTVWKQLGWG